MGGELSNTSTYLFSHLKGFQFFLWGSGILNCQQCRALFLPRAPWATASLAPPQLRLCKDDARLEHVTCAMVVGQEVGNSYCFEASGRGLGPVIGPVFFVSWSWLAAGSSLAAPFQRNGSATSSPINITWCHVVITISWKLYNISICISWL